MAPPADPERASFLGLATETRLQIYTYLLTPYTIPTEQKEPREKRHCCAFPNKRRQYTRLHPDNNIIELACDCKNQNLYPQILRTNKQIFAESKYILYGNMELHVRLPYIISFRDSPLHNAISALPAYAHKHIKRIAIVGTLGEASEKHRDSSSISRHCWRWPLEQYADLISATFPSMRQVRLHIDFGSGGSGHRTTPEAFGFVVGIPTLERVEVEVDGGGMPIWQGCWASQMREMVAEAVRKAAAMFGPKDGLEVREIAEESQEGKGMLAACGWMRNEG